MPEYFEYGFPYPPYDVQLRLMDALTKAMDEGAVGFFESPTGTGKTLSVICATMTWLLNHRFDPTVMLCETGQNNNDIEGNDEPDWVAHQTLRRRVSDLRALQSKRAKNFQSRLHNAKSSPHVGSRGVKVQRLGNGSRVQARTQRLKSSELDDRFLVESEPPIRDLFEFDEVESLDKGHADGDFPADREPRLRIIFATRTHSQISQFIGELRKTRFSSSVRGEFQHVSREWPLDAHVENTGMENVPLSMVAFGSRKIMCINRSVRELPTSTAVSDRCRDLLGAAAKTAQAGQGLKRERETSRSKHGCEFKNEVSERLMRDLALTQEHDVEDMLDLGRKQKGCPYFASRAALASGTVDIIAVPYTALLHAPTRDSLDIEIDSRTTVVFDEAHNIASAIRDIHAATLTRRELLLTHGSMEKYRDVYKSRLGSQSFFHVNQLLNVVEGLLRILPESAQEETGGGTNKSRVVTQPRLIFECRIENVNLFRVTKFLRDSRLCQKLLGFVDAGLFCGNNPTGLDLEDSQRCRKHGIAAFANFMDALNFGSEDGRIAIYPSTSELSSAKARESGLLKYFILSPDRLFAETMENARAILLVGGTLSPKEAMKDALLGAKLSSRPFHNFECEHVVPRSNVLAFVVNKGTSGVPFEFTHRTRNNMDTIDELGAALLSLVSITPGGAVLFFASYSFMEIVVQRWTATSCMKRLHEVKPLYVEVRGEMSAFEGYSASVRADPKKGAVLAAVLGGRLSEGINFSDEFGRVVVIVGMPFANARDLETSEVLKALPDGRRRAEYLENACMTVVNQAIGRAIRHKADYASILLFDRRYSRPRVINKLPRIIRDVVVPNAGITSARAAMSPFFQARSTSE